ncbi:MAG: PRD domain-containing protein [Lachnospiraceae bacterium]|jgi:mannitol operon transcriptional antiterminator|nr:PRD domain-containing protein [Lachnospiraceae bacterium]
MATNVSDTQASSSRTLTRRQRDIVKILAKTAGNPVPVGAISEKLDVSSRTILRELPAIEQWLSENDFTFIKKPGVGVSIEEDKAAIELLLELLGISDTQTGYSQKERRRQILGELLFVREPIKSYVFLSRFHISEGTLAKDLDALEEWLLTYQVKILRRPGVGIFLEGTETAYRQAIANAALEFMDDGEILSLLRGSEQKNPSVRSSLMTNRLFSFMDTQIVAFVEEILADTEKELHIQYTDSGYMALVVHLSLSIKRLRSGEKIEMDQEELQNLTTFPEYPVAKQIARRIGERFSLSIPAEEIGFITMHLSSARIWPQTRRLKSQLQSINTRQVVMSIVERVEAELHLPFHTCNRMIEELTSHMDSMISRLSMNIQLDNSQGDAIRQKYPDIYQAVERACGLFRERLYIEDISPSEITFVAMHFAAAAETLRVEQKKIAVAVVCPSGMGASRMLAANLIRSLHNIDIRQIMSAFRLEPQKLLEDGIDLVISTVPLQIDFPNVCVSPIPQTQDMLVITHAVDTINRQKTKESDKEITAPLVTQHLTLSDVRSLTRTGEEIEELLDHFLIKEISGICQVESLLGQAASVFADTILERQLIGQDLARREAIKNTFIPELGIYLLHCRTMAVRHCRCAFLSLQEPIQMSNGTLEGAILLLAPQSEQKECLEVISRISMLLVEDKRFLQALKSKNVSEGYALAKQALLKYYQNLIIKRKGDGTL